jgi:hypothetical protein
MLAAGYGRSEALGSDVTVLNSGRPRQEAAVRRSNRSV